MLNGTLVARDGGRANPKAAAERFTASALCSQQSCPLLSSARSPTMAIKKAAAKVFEPVGPPSRLSKVLESLKSGHQPHLADVKGLKLKYAFRNDHWGARYVELVEDYV